MAPPKASRANHEDSKSETPIAGKEKPSSQNHQQTNGKLRRVASSTGSNLREVTNAAQVPPASATGTAVAAVGAASDASNPGLQWAAFDRVVLHAYRRAYRLNTPAAFASDYRSWVLSAPGSIGQYSPTMARQRRDFRRQSKDQLAGAVRRHFNGLGIQENDVVVDFLHKVRGSGGVGKSGKTRRIEHGQSEH